MKHEIIILQGIQASGKTTWAKNWVKESPEHRIRINQDDIRNMLGVYWVPNREPLVKVMCNSFINEAMNGGYDIVIDNMNLNPQTITQIKEIVNDYNKWISLSPVDMHYEIKFQTFFDVTLEECIERDSKRENPIGEKIIKDTYNKYSYLFK